MAPFSYLTVDQAVIAVSQLPDFPSCRLPGSIHQPSQPSLLPALSRSTWSPKPVRSFLAWTTACCYSFILSRLVLPFFRPDNPHRLSTPRPRFLGLSWTLSPRMTSYGASSPEPCGLVSSPISSFSSLPFSAISSASPFFLETPLPTT